MRSCRNKAIRMVIYMTKTYVSKYSKVKTGNHKRGRRMYFFNKSLLFILILILFTSFTYAKECYIIKEDCPECIIEGHSLVESSDNSESLSYEDEFPDFVTCQYGEYGKDKEYVKVEIECYDDPDIAKGWYDFWTKQREHPPPYDKNSKYDEILGLRSGVGPDCVRNLNNQMGCSGWLLLDQNLIKISSVVNYNENLGDDKYDDAKNRAREIIKKAKECFQSNFEMKDPPEKPKERIHGTIWGFDMTMSHVKLTLNGETITTSTYGEYEFTQIPETGKEYTIKVELSYESDKTYFTILQGKDGPPTIYHHKFTYNSQDDLKQDMDLELLISKMPGFEWAKGLVSIYQHMSEALEFYKDILEVEIDFQLPVEVHAFVDEKTGLRYWYDEPGKSIITIDYNKAIHESPYRPMNREYHEFSHYMMHALYKEWPIPIEVEEYVEELNHGGFSNPSTSDSFVEGFAIFMSAVIEYTYDDSIPHENEYEGKSLIAALDHWGNSEPTARESDIKVWHDGGHNEERCVAGILWDLVDKDNTYGTPEDLYERYLKFKPELMELYELAREEAEKNNETIDPLPEYSLEYFKNLKVDDDNVKIEFEELWEILSEFHPDFTSVYDALIKKFGNKKDDIDQIFINHGFFIDKTEGNKEWDNKDVWRDLNRNYGYDSSDWYTDMAINPKWDEGEKVGTPSNYQRQWRKSTAEIPGYFIKVDNEVPFYIVEVIFPTKIHLSYEIRTRNEGGKVFIEVPSIDSNAVVKVTPEDVSSEPLIFTSLEFHKNFPESYEKGYFKEHHFDIEGDIPPQPSMPTNEQLMEMNEDSNGKGTPGFELILFVCVSTLVLFWKRKRK